MQVLKLVFLCTFIISSSRHLASLHTINTVHIRPFIDIKQNVTILDDCIKSVPQSKILKQLNIFYCGFNDCTFIL